MMTGENRPPPEGSPLPPHPPLTEYYPGSADRLRFVRQLFDSTAGEYDRLTQIFSLGTGRAWRADSLRRAGLAAGEAVLDVATGTGMLAAAAREQGGRVVALDLSAGMLAVARTQPGIAFVQGTADALPFADARFDLVTMGYALRHAADLTATFREFARVLRPGGRVLLLEIRRPEGRLPRLLARAYLGAAVPALSRLARGGQAGLLMRYYADTIEHCVPPAAILAALGAAGLAEARCDTEWGVFAAYSARRP